MKPFEQRALDLADRLIAKYGYEGAVWSTITNATPPDPAKPWLPGAPGSFPNADVDLCFVPENQIRYMIHSEIPSCSKYALMSGNQTFVPTLKDKVTVGSTILAVVWLNKLDPAGNVLLWFIGFNE